MNSDSKMVSVLVADDHNLLIDMIEMLLASEGDFTVHRAASLGDALNEIATHGPFDVVLLDLDMPGMQGMRGMASAVEANAGGRVVLFSGQARQEAIFRALEVGAFGFIPKNLSAKSLVNAIRFVASGETYIPSTVASGLMRVGRDKPASGFTDKEMEVLRCICRGDTNKDIARQLGLTEVTIKMHVRSICGKMNVSNRTQIAMTSVAQGLV